MKYHLGCGDIRLDGWINVDVRPTAAADVICGLSDVSSLPPEASAIYACHVLEHFGFHGVQPSALDVLRGWVGLLAHGGECFLSVPDLQKVGAAIAASDDIGSDFNFMKCIYGGCEYPQNRHFIGFTRRLLTHYMEKAGLVDVREFEPFAPDTSRFVLHGCSVSLNLCGRKP